VNQFVTNRSGLLTLYGFVYPSGFISTLIALERCICTTHPFTAQKFFQTKATVVIVVVASGVLTGLHYFPSNKYRFVTTRMTTMMIVIKGKKEKYISGFV
jgi:uncharacterized membrane protein